MYSRRSLEETAHDPIVRGTTSRDGNPHRAVAIPDSDDDERTVRRLFG